MYEQIADDLRVKIGRGVYGVGSTLPSTQRLMQEYGASITAVRAAVNLLKQEGIAVGQPGKGVYVQHQPEATEVQDDVRVRLEQLSESVHSLTERVAKLERQRNRPSR